MLARPAIAPVMQRQCTLTVIDLGFFARQEFESVELGRLGLLQRPAEALDAVVATGKAVLVDQVLIDRRCIATEPNLRFDPFAVRLAGRAGILRSRWPGWRNLHLPVARAGGHGGLCPPVRQRARDLADGLAVYPRLAVDLVLRDALAQQRLYRVPLLLRQDIHSCSPRRFRGPDDVLPCPPARRRRQPPMVSYWGILKWPSLGEFGWPPGRTLANIGNHGLDLLRRTMHQRHHQPRLTRMLGQACHTTEQ